MLGGIELPSGQSLCTPLTHRVAFIRWFACSFPFSATPSRYLVTRDWVGAVGCTCDVSHGFTPQDYSRRMHKMGSGPEGWPGRIDYRRSSMATSRRILGGIILGLQAQPGLPSIDPGSFGKVVDGLDFVEAAHLGQQASGLLQPFKWLPLRRTNRNGERVHIRSWVACLREAG